MIALYLILLATGVCLFVLSYVAQFRLTALFRTRYPQHWQVVTEADQAMPSAWRRWVRMQHVLRSPALPALNDPAINRWRQFWRFAPGLGSLCWLAALVLRLLY